MATFSYNWTVCLRGFGQSFYGTPRPFRNRQITCCQSRLSIILLGRLYDLTGDGLVVGSVYSVFESCLNEEIFDSYNVPNSRCKTLHPGLTRTEFHGDCMHYSSIEKYTIQMKQPKLTIYPPFFYPIALPPEFPRAPGESPTNDPRQPHHNPASKHLNSTHCSQPNPNPTFIPNPASS